ncbi:hypothetical protein NDU88_001946 [Pleurodeles waltl]|uniref:Uncharacterized protein n=1 Tax=Pleurodeles waltl TaxID=8319 RepID=A0AAV7R8K1_PLEWA|nr:hypothetical protein NDU88_001946 [Pleurodeles waltl]
MVGVSRTVLARCVLPDHSYIHPNAGALESLCLTCQSGAARSSADHREPVEGAQATAADTGAGRRGVAHRRPTTAELRTPRAPSIAFHDSFLRIKDGECELRAAQGCGRAQTFRPAKDGGFALLRPGHSRRERVPK